MPWLPLYLAPGDVPELLACLGEDIAFIVPDGPGRWRAVREFVPAGHSRTALWHVPSGPLPLMGAEYLKEGGIPDVMPTGQVEDPWAGWQEQRQCADPGTPFFGAGDVGVFWLNLRVAGREAGSSCGMSCFEWIGNHYSIIGSAAPEVTERRWAKLRRQVAKLGQKVPRGGLAGLGKPEIWAFPKALEDLDVADINP